MLLNYHDNLFQQVCQTINSALEIFPLQLNVKFTNFLIVILGTVNKAHHRRFILTNKQNKKLHQIIL